ncbi:hypothetical protein B4143_2073 [Bacillus subtilis]|nr:hypothetical protein B4143_2073 [Bacillus subtilis]
MCPSRSTPSEAYIFSVFYCHYRKKKTAGMQQFFKHTC